MNILYKLYIEFSSISGGTKYHYTHVKLPGTASYWKDSMILPMPLM